jgi:hypothetical protein
LINGLLYRKNPDKDTAISVFADLWSKLAAEYLDDLVTAEYHSIKHGFRVEMGRMRVLFAPDETGIQKPPDSEFKLLTETISGLSFLQAEQIKGAPEVKKSKDPHFRLVQYHTNLHPEFTVGALHLIAASILNIRAFLKANFDRKDVKFSSLRDFDVVNKLWSKRAGLNTFRSDWPVEERNIKRYSRDEILKMIAHDGPEATESGEAKSC